MVRMNIPYLTNVWGLIYIWLSKWQIEFVGIDAVQGSSKNETCKALN